MNQYEIELRDKYFEKMHDALMGSDQAKALNLKPGDIFSMSNDYADKFMAERQERLDALYARLDGEVYKGADIGCSCGWFGNRGQLVKGICPDCSKEFVPYPPALAHKVQGTECDR